MPHYSLNSIEGDTTPQLGGELNAQNHSIGFTEQALVVTAQACAINWKNGNKAKLIVDDDVTITFGTNPSKSCSLILVIVQDEQSGGHTVTLPSTIKWAGGTAPTLSTGANKIDIISLYFDGSVYYGVTNLDFKTA